MVAWEDVCLPLKFGGLGIGRFWDFNCALLFRWLWRFGLEDGSLWWNLVVAKYNIANKWETKKILGAHGVSLWKSISSLEALFKETISMDIGRGNDTLFWHDRWCAPMLLKEEAPRMFSLAIDKQALVASYWNSWVDSNGWNVPLRRYLNDWEIDQMARLIDVVEHSHPCDDREDKRIWFPSKNGVFSVKSSHGFIVRREESEFNWMGICKIKCPLKFSFSCGWLSKIAFLLGIFFKKRLIPHECVPLLP